MTERDVFIAALQIEARAERQAYLHAACTADEALRHRVNALLETHDRAGNFLQEPVLVPVAAADSLGSLPPWGDPTGTQAETVEIEPPSLGFLSPPQQPDELGRLGHYRVLRLLGQGGMGLVFLADDTRLERPVALKVMRPELAANPTSRQRFLQEGRAAANVHSDHVVTIYHVGQEGDLPYLVMELLSGRSLAEALEKGNRLPLELCLKVACETAEGLAAAHASGLIHRDVKPSNLWLESVVRYPLSVGDPGAAPATDSGPRTTDVQVKLLDFGLARAVAGSKRLTQEGLLIGTPAYMAPEQTAGGPVDARSDLFSLGTVLYRMTTGKEPFERRDTIATLLAVATESVPPPREVNSAVPAALSELIMRLLAKDPTARPASAAEVARALRALEQETTGLDLAANPQPAGRLPQVENLPTRPTRWWRLALAGGLGLAGLAIAALVAALIGAFHDRPDPNRASADAAPAPTADGVSRGRAAGPPPASAAGRPEPAPVRPFALASHPYGQVQALVFTADSRTLVSADYGGEVTFWDLDRRQKTFQMVAVPGGGLQSIAVDAQRRWLAVGQVGPDIRLFRFGEPVAAGLLKGHTDRVLQLAFLKDGRTLLSTGYDGSVRRWDVEKQQEDGKPLRPPGRRVDTLAVWEDGRGGLRLAFTSYGKDFAFVAVDDMELEHATASPDRVALSPDGTRLACTAGGNGNGVALWDLRGKTRLGYLPEAGFPRALAFTPQGRHVVVTDWGSTRIYRTDGGQLMARVDHPERAVSLAVSPDGRWLAVGTLKGSVRVWHLPSLLARPG